MGSVGQDADASFFTLMHHFLAASNKGEAISHTPPVVDQRTAPRSPYRLTQRIARGYCWEVPPEDVWSDVLCHDLTQGGVSFFLDSQPAFERLVVMFRAAQPIYIAAKVTHWRPVFVDAQGEVIEVHTVPNCSVPPDDTEGKVLVGCQFLRRFSK